jgi:hypothetical protein
MALAIFRIFTVALAIALTACSGLLKSPGQESTGPDGIACVGYAPTSAFHFSVVNNDDLLASARAVSGKGGICAARAFVAVEPIVVYRVYDVAKGNANYGKWWSFNRPAGPKDAYRAAYGICKEWSNLDRLISCQVKPGAEIVLGTTQSADCQDVSYKTHSSCEFSRENKN